MATAALAQQAPNIDTQSATGVLEEIPVTPQKHSETLEKVPLSIVAYTAEALTETGVQDFASLAARIPGVTLNSAGKKQAALSQFISGNYSASTRVRMYTNRPRTAGLSLRWKF